ncbi:Methylamine dehydrogenase light chain [Alloalcanivorax dieselolei B5]|uniref:Methylamine dehydrogenase light chain n=1 Tax=Alcanivorax dieselolei (strain DSM 16502 / CGMCC 1.3690 / MCCC 1A00001 / B-5) TaxID=930169 RepID=K0C4Y8_ALCDB|nr:methylamine dehydrogenase light chain [Alloalcanivorax dieselolei]AFT68449.1 Methylamine dehydrogenase light chain [Alloalcanivorax dieselolei B5]GGJ99582.1 hypothetical protein GCM10007426_30890 [Alloalcanivorax dieselolei]
MKALFDLLLGKMDGGAESFSRRVAQRVSRRSFISKMGMAFVGGSLLPVLPYNQSNRAWADAILDGQDDDPNECEYWRYCALDGNLCNDCGGSLTSCPPGSEASKVAWVGTCHNPNDGRDYLVSYNDCCGRAECNGTFCVTSERERPGYQMGVHNDINWCMANTSQGYHCTVAMLVGVLDDQG